MQRFWKKNTHWGRDFIKDALRRGNEGRHKESVDTVGWIVSLAAKLFKHFQNRVNQRDHCDNSGFCLCLLV